MRDVCVPNTKPNKRTMNMKIPLSHECRRSGHVLSIIASRVLFVWMSWLAATAQAQHSGAVHDAKTPATTATRAPASSGTAAAPDPVPREAARPGEKEGRTEAGVLTESSDTAHATTDASNTTPARRKRPPRAIDLTRQPSSDIHLYVGESRLIKGLPSTRVVVGSDKVATAAVMDNREVMLFANAPGTVTMQIWDLEGKMRSYRLVVAPADMPRLADDIANLLADVPNVTVTPVGDKVIIDGRQLGDENLHKIAALTKSYDNVVNLTEYQRDNGGWDRMVMMDVKIVEFKNKDKLRELGIRWDSSINGPMAGVAGDMKVSSLRGGNGGGGGGGGFYVMPSQDANIQGFDTLQRPIAPFRTYAGLVSVLYSKINLMASDGDATVLAEPQLTARSGKAAMMNVGGRFPIQVSSGLGERRIQFERYGVQLNVTPWVDPNGMINAKLKAEVSEPDGSVSIDGMPAFRERVVETVFNVTSGQTMVLSGLLQKSKSKSVTKFPLLGDIPLLGVLFRSTREAETESEVAIFVTPRVVDARSDGVKKAVQTLNERVESHIGPVVPPVEGEPLGESGRAPLRPVQTPEKAPAPTPMSTIPPAPTTEPTQAPSPSPAGASPPAPAATRDTRGSDDAARRLAWSTQG